jgi:tRNA-dihydrouridine synthase B
MASLFPGTGARNSMKIGPYQIHNRTILAPMAGVTDLPYRNLCRDVGAGAAVAEMLTSNQTLWHSRKSSTRQIQKKETGLRWIQILGNDPEQMANAARACEKQGAHIIDINMGCPAKKVCKKAAGSALMQDEALVDKILSKVVASVTIPVTLKIRSGWSKDNKNAMLIGRIAEQSGIAALSVHGRTRACKYDEAAEYETAANLKQALRIPVVVNGDITSPAKAKMVLEKTGADGIMVGRAALGNPWLFNEIDQFINHNKTIAAPAAADVYACILKHVRELHLFYGAYMGPRIARKHVVWYEEKFPRLLSNNGLSLKKEFNQLTGCEEQLELIAGLLDDRDCLPQLYRRELNG